MISIESSTGTERELVDQKLVRFNQEKVPCSQQERFINLSFVLKNEAGEVLGGINTMLYCWQILYVDILFVDEPYRGKGYGQLLLNRAEAAAAALGGYMAHLDTFDWQAKAFYQRCGYEEFGHLPNCPPGHSRFYMSKTLHPKIAPEKAAEIAPEIKHQVISGQAGFTS